MVHGKKEKCPQGHYCKLCGGYYYKKNRIYYAEFIKETGPSYSFAMKRMDMDGEHKKTLAKISNVSCITELTDKYVKYSGTDSREHVKRF